MKVAYVVLYVNDAEACRRFWVDQIGMVEKRRSEAGKFTIAQVGFADQPFAFELVPLALMKDNPDGLTSRHRRSRSPWTTSRPRTPSSWVAGWRRRTSATTRAPRASPSRIPRAAGSR